MHIRIDLSVHLDLLNFQFDEDAWSERLAQCLMEFLPEHQVEYTAKNGPKFSYIQSVKTAVPVDHNLVSCYSFQGASDISVKKCTILLDEQINEDDQTSGEECCKQADSVKAATPQKVGELLASLHILLKNYSNVPCQDNQSKREKGCEN